MGNTKREVVTVADWLTIRNDYINGGGSYRELAEQYGVSQSTIRKRAAAEKWAEARDKQRNKIGTELEQKTAEVIVEKEVKRIDRLLAAYDKLIEKIEQATNELDLAQVTNKKKTKVIEYKHYDRPDKPTKEVIEEKEEILAIRSIIDRKGLQQVASALKAVWDITMEDTSELKAGESREADPLSKALQELAEGMNDADQ